MSLEHSHEKIAEKFSYPEKFAEVDGSRLHYVEAGEGNPILLLHGVPTSCYVWRNIIPHLAPLGRCIAPDLIGFGKSSKPDIAYTVADHIHYLEKFIDILNLKQITIIMHGLGSIIGFNYAMQHEKNCTGLVFYEAFLHSLTGNDVSLPFHEQLALLQGQVKSSNNLLDKMIVQNVMRCLTKVELDHYRQPFAEPAANKPILQYINELSPGNSRSKIEKLINDYSQKLIKSRLPKLMLYSVPGFITNMATVMWAKENLSNIEIVDVGEELHLAQESSPILMGEAISAWLQAVEQTQR